MKSFQCPFVASCAAFLAVFLLSACSTPPKVGGLDAGLGRISIDGDKEIHATVTYINDSTRPIAVQSAEHDLYIAGQRAGRAVLKTPVGLPPLTTVERSLLVVPDGAAGRTLLSEASRAPGASWRLSSRITVNYGGEDIVLRSHTSGELGKP